MRIEDHKLNISQSTMGKETHELHPQPLNRHRSRGLSKVAAGVRESCLDTETPTFLNVLDEIFVIQEFRDQLLAPLERGRCLKKG